MSSFWNALTGRNGDEATASSNTGAAVLPPAPKEPPAAKVPPALPPATAVRPTYGIAQANQLMATLPLEENAELVVRVIRKTLESVGVHVSQLVSEATSREADLLAASEKRRATIAELERRIEDEKREIAVLEAALAETARTREWLELSEAKKTQARPAFGAPALPPDRDSERPTVALINDADVESIRPSAMDAADG